MAFDFELTLTGLNVALIKRSGNRAEPESVRVIAVDTSEYNTSDEPCGRHVPYLSVRVSKTVIGKDSTFEDPIVLPTDDGDQNALWPLAGLGLSVEVQYGSSSSLRIVKGTQNETFFEVSPSLVDCGILSSDPGNEDGYIVPEIKDSYWPLYKRTAVVLRLPKSGELSAREIAKDKSGNEIEWSFNRKKLKFAKSIVWKESVSDRVVIKVQDSRRQLILRPRLEGQPLLRASFTTFPQRIPDGEVKDLKHFHCFYQLAERTPKQRRIPSSALGAVETGGSVICPTSILEI